MNLRVGIIGAGYMARRHLEAYGTQSDVEVVAVAGRTERNREHFLRSGKVGRFFTDYRDLLSLGNIDAVSVVTPTRTHAEIVKRSFQAGCHVLCEKPISLHLHDACEMVAEGEKAGRIFMIGFIMRFYEEFIAVKESIDAGEIGEIRHLWFSKRGPLPAAEWYFDPAQSGGVTFEIGVHLIDWARWMAGSPLETVSAVISDAGLEKGISERARISMGFADSATGVVECSFGAPSFQDIGIIGSRHALSVADRRVLLGDYEDGNPGVFRAHREISSSPTPADDPMKKEIEHFIECIRDNREPSVTGSDGVESMRAASAAVQAAERGEKIRLEDFMRNQGC